MALSWSMDKIGPMCRSVEDCALVFSAIYGPDGRDMSVTPQPFQWDPALDPRDLRVAYVEKGFELDESVLADKDAEQVSYIRATLRNSLQVLDVMRDAGFDLMQIELPQLDTDALFPILVAEAAAAFDEITRDDRVSTMRRQDDDAWPNTFRAARFIPAVEYINANRLRTRLMHEMAAVMSDIDVFIVPSHGANAMQITNFTGHPTVSSLTASATNTRRPASPSSAASIKRRNARRRQSYQDATDWHQQYPA